MAARSALGQRERLRQWRADAQCRLKRRHRHSTGSRRPASDRAGRGFSHFFGLNDLVSRPTPLFFEKPASSGSDLHGLERRRFRLSYQVKDSFGRFDRHAHHQHRRRARGADVERMERSARRSQREQAQASANTVRSRSIPTPARLSLHRQAPANSKSSSSPTAPQRGGIPACRSPRCTASPSRRPLAVPLEVDVDPQIAAETQRRLAVGRPNLTAAIGTRSHRSRRQSRRRRARRGARRCARFSERSRRRSRRNRHARGYAARLGGEAGRLVQRCRSAPLKAPPPSPPHAA